MACRGSGVQIPSAPPQEKPPVMGAFPVSWSGSSGVPSRQPHKNPTRPRIEGICGIPIHALEKVAVRVERGLDRRMAEPLLDGLTTVQAVSKLDSVDRKPDVTGSSHGALSQWRSFPDNARRCAVMCGLRYVKGADQGWSAPSLC